MAGSQDFSAQAGLQEAAIKAGRSRDRDPANSISRTAGDWRSEGRGPLQASVERVSPGPGRWEIVLTAGETLRAHLPLHETPPQVNELVSVSIHGADATVICPASEPELHRRETAAADTR